MHFNPEIIAQIFSNQPRNTLIENQQKELSPSVKWQRIRLQMPKGDDTINLAFNLLFFKPDHLHIYPAHAAKINVHDSELKHAIAHAYWQTVWASGHLRGNFGDVESVAFLPLQRRLKSRKENELFITEDAGESVYLIGSEISMLYALQNAVDAGRVFYTNDGFQVEGDIELQKWLQERAFVDAFIGNNKINNGRGCISKIVAVAGSHRISKTVTTLANQNHTIGNHAAIAFTNAGFFLNFPEEYTSMFAAMNDPVGLIIEDGEIYQLPLFERGTILVDEENHALIRKVSMRDIAIRLPWQENWLVFKRDFYINQADRCEDSVVLFTPKYLADQAEESQRTPTGDIVNLVISFGHCVALKPGGGCKIPESGFVLSLPGRANEKHILQAIKRNGNRLSFRVLHENFGLAKIKTALSAGPVLVEEDQIITKDFFENPATCEDFLPGVTNARMKSKGVAPTRFPFDTNTTKAPRTFLALDGDSIVLGVIDGRFTDHSIGASLTDVAQLCLALGFASALNLDGGGSSVLHLTDLQKAGPALKPEIKPGIVNIPSDSGHNDRLMPVSVMVSQ